MAKTTIYGKRSDSMSITSINSSNALYESLLQKLTERTKTSGDNTYANAAQLKTDSSPKPTQTVQPTQQDIKALLSKLLGSQPTLMDFMNSGSSSTDDLTGLSANLESGLGSTTNDLTSFDPLSAEIQALSGMDSNANSNAASSDPLSSIWSSLGSNQSPSELLNLLEKAYSQSSQEAQSEVAAGQVVDKKK
jgi:hypothetical protein